MNLYLVCEDLVSNTVLRKLLLDILIDYQLQFIELGNKGRGYIEIKINDFNNLKSDFIFFLLADLDNDGCAPELIKNMLKRPARENFFFRIAEREVESWLLADIKGFSKFTNLSLDLIRKEVKSPDLLINPKEKLISLVKMSKKRELKNDIVRINETSLKQGPGYNTRLIDFIQNCWSYENAMTKSMSLQRTINAIIRFKDTIS